MTPFHMDSKDQKIHPSQAIWQIFEIVMNAWILWVLVSQGMTLPLILWTVFEVVMNGWILLTMTKVGISRNKSKMVEAEICGHGFEIYKHCILCETDAW